MNLGDLLDELRHGILHDTSDQIAGSSDQLWSDERLCRFINEAQRRFARKALVIRDGTTPSVTQVALTANINVYELHKSVLAVLSAKQVGDSGDLTRSGHTGFDTFRAPDTLFFDPNSLAALPPGKIVAYGTDEQVTADDDGAMSVVNLRTYPAPDAAHSTNNLQLRVVRLPINDFSLTNLTAEPEIPELHHLDILDWAAYLALRIVDLDAEAPSRANDFRASFEASVKEARTAVMRKLFAPQAWGFGRSGFTWSR